MIVIDERMDSPVVTFEGLAVGTTFQLPDTFENTVLMKTSAGAVNLTTGTAFDESKFIGTSCFPVDTELHIVDKY